MATGGADGQSHETPGDQLSGLLRAIFSSAESLVWSVRESRRKLRTRRYPDLSENVIHLRIYGASRDVETLSDPAVAETFGPPGKRYIAPGRSAESMIRAVGVEDLHARPEALARPCRPMVGGRMPRTPRGRRAAACALGGPATSP